MVAEYPSLLSDYTIVLASRSPRRMELLAALGLRSETRPTEEIEEIYPPHMKGSGIPVYLSRLKSEAFKGELSDNEILLTADTIVWHRGNVLGKPRDREEAIHILEELSGDYHMVFTGVCLRFRGKYHTFCAESKVFFKDLSPKEIAYYVDTCQPYDKAGAYGIQEWIGYVGVERIEGSYFNVMGLPVQRLYQELNSLVGQGSAVLK